MPEQPCAFHPDRTTLVTCSRCDRPICPDDMISAPVGIHCPICAGRMREGALGNVTYRARTRVEDTRIARRVGAVSVTKALIAINVGVFVLMLATGRPTATEVLLRFGALPPFFDSGEWWRLITAMFVHIGPMHLLFNMYALYLFGQSMEERAGRARFLALYLVSGLLGSAASIAFSSGGVRAGASGGVFGILGAYMAVFMLNRHLAGASGQLRSLLFLVGINLVIGFSFPGIDNTAHLGGLAAGLLTGGGLELSRRRGTVGAVTRYAGYAVSIVAALVLIGAGT